MPDAGAREALAGKKNLRLILVAPEAPGSALRWELKRISGGVLIQQGDHRPLAESDLKVVTRRRPTDEEMSAMLFAWKVAKHVKSNAIVFAKPGQTIGIGAGQMSRVDSVKIATMKAQSPLTGAVMASDAFFPFRDGLDEAAKVGIRGVIQPGGSIKDEEVIRAADEHDMAMVMTGVRHFRH